MTNAKECVAFNRLAQGVLFAAESRGEWGWVGTVERHSINARMHMIRSTTTNALAPSEHENTITPKRRGPKPGCKLPRLSAETVEQIRQLLRQQRYYDEIKALTGASPASICKLAAKMPGQNRKTGSRPGSRGLHASSRSSTPSRCPECGAKVYMPCRGCEMEGAKVKK
jgi:hypothetical protein